MRPETFDTVIDGVADLGRPIIVTTGRRGGDVPAAAGRPHVRVAQYIPQRLVLDRSAVVVCHGGINTLLGAVARGRPVVVLPTEQSELTRPEFERRAQGYGAALQRLPATGGAVELVLELAGRAS